MVAVASGFGDQPVVEPNGCGEVGRGVEVREQAAGFVKVPTDDGRGVDDRALVHHPSGAVRQHMEERRQTRDVLRGLGCHVPDVGEISACA